MFLLLVGEKKATKKPNRPKKMQSKKNRNIKQERKQLVKLLIYGK